MAEYIEREAVLEKIESCAMWVRSFGELYEDVQDMPPADVAPVRHGRWLLLDECSNEGVYCSVCNKEVYKVCYANQKIKSKFCPNCGALMDGGDNA